ncbi:MAG: hypothetical protein O2826_07020 [Chloroflexi bacterium]|nr:hypothetical protein [Chloroflexota bacterium]
MIIRIALAAPFGLGIFSSLMLIAGPPGYAVAFLCYLFMMVALAVKPPAAIARRLGVEVEEKEEQEQEEREPSEPGEGLLAKIKTLPALVIAFFAGLTAKWTVTAKPPFISRKNDEDEDEDDDDEDVAPAAAAAPPPVEAPLAEAAAPVAEAPAEASAPVDAPVVVPAPVAAAVRGLEAESTGHLIMALLGRFKFWRAALTEDEMVAAAAVVAMDDSEAVGVADDEEYEEVSLTAKLRALGVVVLRMLGTLRKSRAAVDDLADDDLIAAVAITPAADATDADVDAAGVRLAEGPGNLLAFPVVVECPVAEMEDPVELSRVAKLLGTVKAMVGKVASRDAGVPGAKAPAKVASERGSLLAPVMALVGKVASREAGVPGAAAPAKAGAGQGSLMAKVMPRVRAMSSKVVVATGDAAVVPAKPRRPLKESLASVVPAVTTAVLVAVAWVRGVRKDDWVPIVATGWRVGGMATLMVLALPLLAVDLGVMRYRIRKEERAEARVAPEEPNPEELMLDTLVGGDAPEIAA